jgi:hypothetical protein
MQFAHLSTSIFSGPAPFVLMQSFNQGEERCWRTTDEPFVQRIPPLVSGQAAGLHGVIMRGLTQQRSR